MRTLHRRKQHERWDLDVDPPQRKPLLRGWSHAVGAVVAGIAVIALLIHVGNPLKRIPLAVYGIALVLLLTVSAMYHLGDWPARIRKMLQRFDHANIFLFIAATYTPVAVVLLHGGFRLGVIIGAWTCAAAGIATTQFSIRAPRWVAALLYILMGWGAVVILPNLLVVGMPLVLVLAGGILYSLGAVAYATKRPRLWPQVFGYHEVFHLAVLAASLMLYLFMVVAIVPYHMH